MCMICAEYCVSIFMCVSCECECRHVCVSAHIGSKVGLGWQSSLCTLIQTGSFVYHWVLQAIWPLSFWEFCLWPPLPPHTPCSRNPGVADACRDIQLLSGSGNLSAHLTSVQQALSPWAVSLSPSLTTSHVSGWFYLPSDELLIIEENLQIPDQSVCCVVDEAEAHGKKKAF